MLSRPLKGFRAPLRRKGASAARPLRRSACGIAGRRTVSPTEGAAMKDTVKKAHQILKDVMKEFEPAKVHAVGAGREFLLALRSAIDAEINLLDKATGKKRPRDTGGEGKS